MEQVSMETTMETMERVATSAYDFARVRADFPILAREVRGHPLVYLDNAASTQKPRIVGETIADCYNGWYANVERGVHTLSQLATAARERAQAVPHGIVDVQALGCDFYAFSGHKVYGPSGIGALWGRAELLAAMPPWQSGGGMVHSVRFERTTYAPPPHRFEAGTPFIEGAAGLAAALDYLSALGLPAVAAWESQLLALAPARL